MKKTILSLVLSSLVFSANSFAVDAELEKKFLDAVESREAGDLAKAISELENILAASPNLGRARIELAVAYYRSKLFNEARKAAQTVLNDPNTPEEVRLTVTLFLAEIDAQEIAYQAAQEKAAKERHQFSGLVKLGVGTDDNVNAGPSGGTITIGDTVLNFTPGTLPRDDEFVALTARLNHRYTMPELLNIGSKPVKGLWQSTAGIYTKQYQTDNDYTLDVFTLSTGPAFLSQTNWHASIPLQIDYIRLGSDDLGVYTSLSPTYTLIHNDTEFTINPLWQNREYDQVANEGIEGEYYGVSIDALHKFNDKVTGRLGVSAHEGDFDDSHSSFSETSVFGSVLFNAWENGTVYLDGRLIDKDYDAVHPTYALQRDDEYNSVSLGAVHTFKEGDLAKWSINAKATVTDNSSNIAAFDYDREVYVLEVSRNF